MKKAILATLICMFMASSLHAQIIHFENREFEISNVKASIVEMNGEEVLKVERDLEKLPFDAKDLVTTVDEPTFVKLKGFLFEDGIIEVKMLSRIQNPSPFNAARGFIGIAYRINDDNSAFESIYLRPKNGRVDNQFMRNHVVQYYAYPNHKFDVLRETSSGLYETFADVGLNEWITIRIEIEGKKAQLYINDQKYPSFIVGEMLGSTVSGSIGLWVDIGTEGYFKEFKIMKDR